MLYVLRLSLASFDIAAPAMIAVSAAIPAAPAASPETPHRSNANDNLCEGSKLLQSGEFGKAHRMLEEAYEQIKDSASVNQAAKSQVLALVDYAGGGEQLSQNNIAAARDQFHQASVDARDRETEAAALLSEAAAEEQAEHELRALELLAKAYALTANGDLKSTIMMTAGGLRSTRFGYSDSEADQDLARSISDAASARQRAVATVNYAAFIHNINPARANDLLENADTICNANDEWAREMRVSIRRYRQMWAA